MNPSLIERSTDGELWELVRRGSEEAFAVLVRKHQSLVCAVAYNACGNVALSEDVAQETFWAAWRGRDSPEPPTRLRPWLCGIARNLARNAGRRAGRPVEAAAPLDGVAEPSMIEPGPLEAALSREEETLVWKTLARIPESYREPLILFYREGQSVAEVAAALDLSEDAAKQRLSRGRAMLRERMSGLVEDGLRRTRPGRTLTVAVMAGLSTVGQGCAGTATAAGSLAIVGPVVKVGLFAGGLLGTLLGGLIGVATGGGITWVGAQFAPTKSKRDQRFQFGARIVVASILYTAVFNRLILAFADRPWYLAAYFLGYIPLDIYFFAEAFRWNRAWKQLQAESGPDSEPSDSALRSKLNVVAERFRGRVYRSRASLGGIPLVDINVADPVSFGVTPSDLPGNGFRIARGWIAVGDHAHGILLAIGSRTARGIVALGGRAIGVVSLGGVAVGVVSCGGVAVGPVALGGVSLGGLALGGLAVGWWALGWGAIAWDVACGTFVAAMRGASGSLALAREAALGGTGWARHFNDNVARALLGDHPLQQILNWYIANLELATAAIVLLAAFSPGLLLPLMYRRGRRL